MELINQFRYLVGGYYGVSLMDEYPLKEFMLKEIEEYIRAVIKENPIDDFDYKALYPSLMREFNMSISTQVGKIIIDNPPIKPIDYLRLGAGGHFSEDIASYNFIQFAHRWMQFPDIEEMLLLIDKYFTVLRTPYYKRNQMGNLPMDRSHKSVMGFVDRSKPMILQQPMPEWVKREVNKIREEISII